MNNLKRVTAALLAATMIFTSIGNDVISRVNAAETEGPETLAEASETEESEIALLFTAPLFIATKCTQILPSVVFGALLPRIFKQNALENTLRDNGCE